MAIVPDLPKRPSRVEVDAEGNERHVDIDWHEETLQWWADMWASPMAAEYHSSDRHALFLLAVLVDDFWREPSTKLASEIRLQRVAFGLTPYDRRRLEWTIETTEEAKDRGQSRRNAAQANEQPKPDEDPRLVLVS
ncbi:hypothetical protein IT072_02435 [Leifsonia sp. ZF2019]|nr:hypothetical protein [Leifsonia sp. ZF2019]UAJ79955.1 hypothetical protein IT072_02435 [Leifsonia sp. ZF2019]